jgi:F0F1-type ATP synthase assembly protein I
MANQHGEDNDNWSSLWREAMVAMSLGWDLAVPIFGGVLLGYALDRWLQTRYIFTVGLLFLGIAISYYNLARFIRRIDRENGQDEKEVEERS